MNKYLLRNVFVAGGEPSLTYNPRENLSLEEKIRDYLEERSRILSISGPTKSGKTVLVRRIIPKGQACGSLGDRYLLKRSFGYLLMSTLEERRHFIRRRVHKYQTL
ncbi:hypothetical protein [Deinococcus sp. Leaf326]|uniref:hypothetical protein n=1 Tax=Deinococcus sp. Leaf326 TaxID=1736338 RepID=UPI0012E19682|nr:hypothetical protein [Deinococcus sp. Leaf326]